MNSAPQNAALEDVKNSLAGEGSPSVAVIGLGMMGRALAAAFLAGGRTTAVWNRTPGRAGELVAAGAREAASAEAAVRAADLVVVCVRDYEAVHEALDAAAEAGALQGRVLVNLTSGTSQQGRDTAEWASAQGAAYLDGAIMMTPPGIGDINTVVLYGGAPAVYAEHAATLALLGGGSRHLGADPGVASVYDVAMLGLMWSTFNGFLHGVALLGADGIPAKEFLPLAKYWLGAIESFVELYAGQIDAGDFAAVDATLETQLPPIEHLVEESRARGVDTTLPEYTKAAIEAAIGRGHALDSYARIVEHFRG
ncbi:NAD(P)-dependent oxidoreductase [Yinghuangia soli]|uniref:NAD(P)-binding domain-containing protein n=1 Tax=Yinghuangia soli TaxID=2908204 RepID=A0AA41U7V0_9ACTN|nr:NAD(P)-binding domain-containing protein [Yinghuangia soli]MCF2532289.1 NAD(P)-binding domain-containing protein [Yinghuangia soli]